jgi:hypothetical protein
MKTLNKEDRRDYKILSRRYSYCDKHIAWPWNKEIGILLTSHPGNRAYLKASVESHAKTKLWITIAYDNYFDPDRKNMNWDSIMPSKEVIDKVNCFVMGPYQKYGGVMYPYFWLLRLGLSTMRDFPYIYSANGDCIVEKPEGIFTLLEMLKKENADFISCGWWDKERPIFNSTGLIGKSSSVQLMMNHFEKHFIPLKAYEKSCMEFGNTEGRLGRAIKDLGLKVVALENPKNEQLHEKGHGDFCKIAGFRHLHAEIGAWWRDKENKIPPEICYIDEKYFSKVELDELKKWWNQASS